MNSPYTGTGDTSRWKADQNFSSSSPDDSSEAQFLRSWFEFESKTENGAAAGRKAGLFLGLLVILGISGGFWTGIGLLVAHLVR